MDYKSLKVSDLFDLNGQVAALTGASGYLVGTFSRAFGANGVKVALLDPDVNKGQSVADKIIERGGEAIVIKTDVSDFKSIQNAHDEIIDKWGKVDVLLNGANAHAPTPFMEIKEEEWNWILDIQFTGTMRCCQIFGETMLKQGSGSIINISSASAGPPLSKAFAYSAAKAAVKNFTQNLAREWATKGVRVNAIRPGFFPTQWSQENFLTEERTAAILGHTAMQRFGDPKELVGAILWLCSPSASFVTGAEVEVDGGFSAMTI